MIASYKLADIAEVRPGYLVRKGVKPRADGTHHLLQLRDFIRDRSAIDPTSLIRFTPDSRAPLKPLQTGEVVFLARGARNFAFAPANLPVPTLAAGYFFVIHPDSQISPAYLTWFLNQPVALRSLSRSATSGAHMAVVRRPDIENLLIPVPALRFQRTIGELDNLMHEEKALLEDLARKKHELITTACMVAARSDKTIGERE